MAKQHIVGGFPFPAFVSQTRGSASEQVGTVYLVDDQGSIVRAVDADQAVPAFGQTVAATVTVSISSAQNVPAFGVSAGAAVEVLVSASQTLPDFGQLAAASTGAVIQVSANQAVPAFGQLVEAIVEVGVSASQTLAAFTQSAIIIHDVAREAAADQVVPDFAQSALAYHVAAVAAAQSIPDFGQTVVLRRGDVTPGLIFRGVIGNCSINRAGLATLEARSILTLGRGFLSEHFCAACRADLYDARCKVSKDSFSASAAVASVLGQFSFTVTALPDGRAVDGWYDLGQAVITSGDGEGAPFQIKTWMRSTLTVETMTPIDELLDAGDTLTLYAGCNKTSTTCRDKFSNIVNYRGEEYAAGRDLQLTTTGG